GLLGWGGLRRLPGCLVGHWLCGSSIPSSLSPAAEGYADFREEVDGVVVVELLQRLIRQGETGQDGLAVFGKVRVEDGRRSDVGGFPELAVGPEAAGEEVEAAVV